MDSILDLLNGWIVLHSLLQRLQIDTNELFLIAWALTMISRSQIELYRCLGMFLLLEVDGE